jgi:teichoic acid transport system ATP-binding protein
MRDLPAFDLRVLAPLSVGVFAIAIVAVLIASGALSGDSSKPGSGRVDERRSEPPQRPGETPESSREQGTYTVKPGDTLGSIAEDTGVSVDRLQELNPQLDPQTITTGQRINLRE